MTKILSGQTFMVWQNNDDDKRVTPTMVVQDGIDHFTEKYGTVTDILCHHSVDIAALQKEFPEIRFGVEDMIYHPSLFNFYGLAVLNDTGDEDVSR